MKKTADGKKTVSYIGAGLDNVVIECLTNLIIPLLECHNFHFKSIHFTACISKFYIETSVRAIIM